MSNKIPTDAMFNDMRMNINIPLKKYLPYISFQTLQTKTLIRIITCSKHTTYGNFLHKLTLCINPILL